MKDISNTPGFPTVLVIDDMPASLATISDLLAGNYRRRIATNGQKGLHLAARPPQPDLILLDVLMPGMDGYEVCRRLKDNPDTRGIPVIFLTSLDSHEDEARGFAAGGVDYITKPVSKDVLMARVDAQISLVRSRRLLSQRSTLLEELVEQRSKQLSIMQDVIILAMASLAERRESDTNGHVRRIQLFTRALALSLRNNPRYRAELTEESLELLYKTSPLHDIGKVGVPDAVLFKPGKLSEDEFEAMKRHAMFGAQALQDVERRLAAPEVFVSMARDIAMFHHERWDGTGYPMGLKGEDIPLCARIVALADTYDALTSERIYKPPYPAEDALTIIGREQGRQFDPAVVEAFFLCEGEFRNIARAHSDVRYAAGQA